MIKEIVPTNSRDYSAKKTKLNKNRTSFTTRAKIFSLLNKMKAKIGHVNRINPSKKL